MNRIRASCSGAAFAVTAALAVTAGPAAAANAKACGNMSAHGITALKAKATSCATAGDVARAHSYARTTRGWSCTSVKVSPRVERVVCSRGKRRVSFRSTLAIELPAAPAHPSAGSS